MSVKAVRARRWSVAGLVSALVLGVVSTAAPAAADPTPFERVGGSDRYDTSAQLAARLAARHGGGVNEIVLVSNDVDGLGAVTYAAAAQAPIVATPPNALPPGLTDLVARLGVNKVTIIGGPLAVSAHVEAGLGQLGLDTSRISGADRFQTNIAALYQAAFLRPPELPVFAGSANPDAANALPPGMAAVLAQAGASVVLTDDVLKLMGDAKREEVLRQMEEDQRALRRAADAVRQRALDGISEYIDMARVNREGTVEMRRAAVRDREPVPSPRPLPPPASGLTPDAGVAVAEHAREHYGIVPTGVTLVPSAPSGRLDAISGGLLAGASGHAA
ncbi:cell wall-binding repeat-containing protein, partial [Nocardioides massiliensis]